MPINIRDRFRAALKEVVAEFANASSKHRPLGSAHEGYAVILEEVEELWEEVMKNPKKVYGDSQAGTDKHRAAMRSEAVQIAAMAIRFMVDVC